MILIVSAPKDGHATEVIGRLRGRGAAYQLLDLSEFPRNGLLSIEYNGTGAPRRSLAVNGASIDFAECNVVWWRRPQPFAVHDEIPPGTDHNFAYTECHAAVSGLWLTLAPFWINHPTKDDEAARKVYQLKVAQEIGLTIPDTCITSDPALARRFVAKHGIDHVIYKAFSGTEQAWRETRLLKTEELQSIDKVRYAPVIFQRHIPAQADLRITVIGDQVFACAIDSRNTDYTVDFRMVMDQADMTAFDLPDRLRRQLAAYVRRLNLVYGAIDMRLTPDGEYVFLEINPSGQWLFVEQRTGLPITDALTDLMVRMDKDKVMH